MSAISTSYFDRTESSLNCDLHSEKAKELKEYCRDAYESHLHAP